MRLHRQVVAVVAAGTLIVAACSSGGAPDIESSDATPPVTSDSSDTSTSEPNASSTSATAPENDEPDVSAPSATAPSNTASVDTAPAEEPDNEATGTLDWALCEEQSNPLAETECATLRVPLDYGDPEGEQIDIAVARVVQSSGNDRIGSLVFNPGGPGGSGIEFLTQAVAIVPADVASRFDLVSFDPRGVGASTALECAIEIDDNITLVAEGDDAAYQELLDDAAALGDECTAATLDFAPYVGTDNVARDLDVLREALGDDGLTYVGYSYGTRLGATYAELFPQNVRALVLDAAVKPTDDATELDRGQAGGFDLALANFAAACDADEDCILREVGPTLDVLTGLRTEIAEQESFPTDDPERVLTPGELELGVIASLYSKEAWPFLAQALFTADANQDGTLLQVLGDSLVGRQPDGTYDNSQVANSFINCADMPARPDAATARANADEVAALSTSFSEILRSSTGCLGVPESAAPITLGPAVGAPPILVIGNTGDPATPYEWSVELADFLSSGVLYTVEAEGHTAYGSIECVTDDVNAYLIDLTVPDEGASCSDNADADFFVPEAESEIGQIIALFDCLRENGLDVPELTIADILADPTGEGFADALDPSDPAFQAAALQCRDILADLAGG